MNLQCAHHAHALIESPATRCNKQIITKGIFALIRVAENDTSSLVSSSNTVVVLLSLAVAAEAGGDMVLVSY